jgi:transcriptional regulator with GAF, ATPase, and Fis domain
MARLEDVRPEALLVDSWLPDLEVSEFAGQIQLLYPAVELMRMDGGADGGARSPRRNELLHALREAQEQSAAVTDTAAWNAAPLTVPRVGRIVESETVRSPEIAAMLPEMIGESAVMRELARLIRLVAPRSTTVLIEGETGTGKEVVAKAVHRLSERAGKPFVVLNCAAIPESLLEAELFGHTRGAFTGAVQSRTGRIEAAHGGTLFLDEIGEMPLALQAKMLRFLEYGELQRVGDNETTRVDVRIIAATHQPLEKRSEEGTFRLDLYHRLAVFPVEVPALRDRMEDLGLLVEHILMKMGQRMPRKRLSEAAMARLREHAWPGNVRELMHVLERASILAGENREIGAEEIRPRRATR